MSAVRSTFIRRVFLALNYVALVAACANWFYVAAILSLDGDMKIVTLDREQVFDEQRLRKYSPHLAANIRSNVAEWIFGPTLRYTLALSSCLGGLTILNIFGYHAFKNQVGTSNEVA